MADRAARDLAAMANSPAGDWTIADIERICVALGITCRPPTRGDHYKVSSRNAVDILTIPARRPIKPVYISKFVKLCRLHIAATPGGRGG